MRPADRAWIALSAGVLAYEAMAKPDELLSEACDRYMLKHPWLTRGICAAIALHLCNAMPTQCDPLHWLFVAKRMTRS